MSWVTDGRGLSSPGKAIFYQHHGNQTQNQPGHCHAKWRLLSRRALSLLLALAMLAKWASGQQPLQVVRGKVVDAITGQALEGASVLLCNDADTIGTATGADGRFRFDGVPVGRYRLEASHLGYAPYALAEVLVGGGKETVVEAALLPHVSQLGEVVVRAPTDEMALLPAGHRITVEEQFRFPATYYDPARLVQSYPAVTGLHDGTNLLSVRGHSPTTLRWRLQGLDIVNPNHTANAGTLSDRPTTAAGGVNILSAQVLDNSRFLPGNFPPGYGDALGGVLDMHLRKGNDEHTEWTLQAGFIGLEAAAEGPVGKKSARPAASWLANYRYSFTGLLTALGADFGDEQTAFQDLSFHLSVPLKKGGSFGFFGVGGASSTRFHPPADSASITEDKQRYDIDFESEMGLLGVSFSTTWSDRAHWRTAAAWSGLEHRRVERLLIAPPEALYVQRDLRQQHKFSLRSQWTIKINNQLSLRTGLAATRHGDSIQSDVEPARQPAFPEGTRQAWWLEAFVECRHRLAPRLWSHYGLHLVHLTASPPASLPEPRLSLQYLASAHDVFTLAYGLHSQQQLLPVYLLDESQQAKLLRAHHLSLRWRHRWSDVLAMTLEASWQHLFHVPVAASAGSPFSTLNLTDEWSTWPRSLRFNGTGDNRSLELTLQRFMSQGFYFLVSGALMASHYEAADGKRRPTAFDARHTLSMTAGREVKKQKGILVRTWGLNLRVAWIGGLPATPIDVEASRLAGTTVYALDRYHSQRLRDYFRLDVRLYLNRSGKGSRTLWSLDIQNLTNRLNPQYEYFDTVQNGVATKTQLGLIPILSWRREF